MYLSGVDQTNYKEGLAEGKQYIQRLENYIAGNDSYHVSFDLNYNAIRQAWDLGGVGTKVSDTHRNIVYFDHDLVMISVSYRAPFFGTAGDVNVIFDFHEDEENPQIYIQHVPGI